MHNFLRMKQTQIQDKRLKRNPSSILLLGIMFLTFLQVILLLSSSGSINQLPSSEPHNEKTGTVESIKEARAEIKEVTIKLNEILAKPAQVESKKPEVTIQGKVADTDVNQAVNDNRTNKNTKNHNAKSLPALISHPPVMLTSDKQLVKPQTKTTKNNKTALVTNNPVVAIPVSVKANDRRKQPEEKPADKAITVTDIKPVYIKYDINGIPLKSENVQWSCVFDTRSGLMWEVKSKDDSIRNPDNLYSWFNPDNRALQGVTDGGRCKGGIECDTNAYIKAMNRKKFCGHNDWRLPTQEEMLGLVKYENGDKEIKIDTSYFPFTLPSWYWTASSNASRPEYAWYVLFKNGLPLNDLKENPKHIRLVRSQSSS